ncbi:hypothetical protein SNE40_006921 [Patella caerulea]|uniref:EF-hand domain-containing protein n=1 Tax=Patella caerulea TaxID=87958 RepID=A0AAN8PU96_PATCE
MAEVYHYQPSPPSSAGAMQIAMSGERTPTSVSSRRSTTPGSFYKADTPEFEQRGGGSGSSTGVKRWKRLHEQQTMEQLSSLRHEKKESILIAKQKARETARKISVELLAKEWLSENQATVEIRAYLVDKLLPTLILGVEKLLTVVDFQELADKDRNANFNPLNFLAQYLLRNNPKYSNFAEASPYVRGIRQVSEDLRMQLFNMEDNRLAKIKADVKRRRTEREYKQHLTQLEKIRRSNCLLTQFTEWNVAVDGRVELSLFQNALRSFNEVAEHFPEELKRVSRLGHSLEPTDETGITLTLNEFVKYMNTYIENLPREVFEQFMVHMSKCAAAYRASAEREQRRIYLSNLFMRCDHSGIALLDRHRILNLFEQYWDQMKNDQNCKGLRNPRQWPVVEVDEADDSVGDDEEEDEPSTQQTTEEVAQESQQVLPQPPPASIESTQKTLDENKDLKEEVKTETKEEEIKEEQKVEVEGNKTEENPTQEPEVVETGETPQEIKQEGKDGETQNGQVKEAESKDGESNEEVKDGEAKDGEVKDGEVKEAEVKEVKEAELKEAEVKDAELKDAEVKEAEVKEAEVKEAEVKEATPEKKETADSEKEKNETKKATDTGSGTDTVKPVKPKSALKVEREEPVGQTGRISVTFAEGTTFNREKTGLTLTSRSQSQMSAFDENSLNVSQFVQLTETFLGDEPVKDVFTRLLKFIKDGYEETEDEKMDRLTKARREAVSAKRKSMIDVLFEKWDNDGSGYLDLEEVESVMAKYKDGQEVEAIYYAKEEMKKKSRFQDQRLSKREFRMLIQLVVQEIPGSETFDSLLEFLTNSVERSYSDRIRGEARKKWLQQIVTAAETGGASMEPVYRAVFQALYKDAEAHGGGKKISANISMSERNVKFPQRGETCLRYVAATPEDADYVLDKILYNDMKGVSFAALESGKPIHVPRVGNHGNIHFWNTRRRPEEREGSFIVIPLKDKRKRAFGLLGIDTIADPHTKAIFITHEIQFFQGIAKAFSIAYHHVDMRRKLLRITESAVSWIQRRSPHVREVVEYMAEPDSKGMDYVLRKMLTTVPKGPPEYCAKPPRLERKDNLFRDYLFKCVDNSETVTADAYGERHLAFPLRDDDGKAIALVDISIGDMKKLPPHENKEIQRMLRILQMAHKEITKEFNGAEKMRILEGEQDDEARTDIMFDRLMLMELRDNVSKLDQQAYAELRSYKDPPQIICDILKATLAIFFLDKAEEGEFDDWIRIKTYINIDLSQKITAYDPTAQKDLNLPADKIELYMKDVPHGEVAKHGSLPGQYMYNWVFVCLSLIEHMKKMRQNEDEGVSSDAVSDKEEDVNMDDQQKTEAE